MLPTFPTMLEAVAGPFKRAQLGLFHGKMKQYGNNVPFSKHKTRRSWLPNIQSKTLYSEALGKKLKLKVTTRALKTIKKVCKLCWVCVYWDLMALFFCFFIKNVFLNSMVDWIIMFLTRDRTFLVTKGCELGCLFERSSTKRPLSHLRIHLKMYQPLSNDDQKKKQSQLSRRSLFRSLEPSLLPCVYFTR